LDKKIVCFGEMLWDVFPKEKIAGGAPMNVALHLHHMKADVVFISRVGNDQDGQQLTDIVRGHGLPTLDILIDPSLPTGKVLVDDRDKENIRYDIVRPSAWDNIEWNEGLQQQVDQADAFLFGSLAAREERSRKSLLQFLKTDTLKIFDINLRAPFYSFELLQELLFHTDILKLNEEELQILIDFHGFPQDTMTALDKMAALYDLEVICVTKGKNGAGLFIEDEFFNHPGYPVTVQDTVGSGDAFLSAFVINFLEGKNPEQLLDEACALGALVATRKGGTPKYNKEDIERIKGK